MKKIITYTLIMSLILGCRSGKEDSPQKDVNILFLHHSTGMSIWQGKQNITGKVFKSYQRSAVKEALDNYSRDNNKNYQIQELAFPKDKPYGWNNYPFDYYNIWVRHAGDSTYLTEPTLEILTKKHNVIIWKHCFPVSKIRENTGSPEIASQEKTIENYKLQYLALRDKMQEFPNVKFIVWTGAALVKGETTEKEAERAREFFNWVKNDWDIYNDNIFIWDFWELQTDGGLYFSEDKAMGSNNSHPNEEFSEKAAGLFAQRIIDVIEYDGSGTALTGIYK